MRIAHFISDLNVGGSEVMLVDIINEQIKNNQVTLIILNNEINELLLSKIHKKIKVIKINRPEKSRNPYFILKLNWYILLDNPDVIHCHIYSAARIILFRKNLVLTVHSLNNPIEYHKKYTKVFAISNEVKHDIEKRCDIKAITIYNGIDNIRIQQKTNYSYDFFRIIQLGRLEHQRKGQHILLKAIKILVFTKLFTKIRLDFIGDGESLNILKELVNKYQLEEYVKFLGFHDREYIYEHLQDYNLLVQPSIYEGFGLSIVEAMTAKIPVLISNIEAPMEILQNGKYGWTFESMNSIDCAIQIQNIIKAYNNPEFHEKINNAFLYANHFSIRNTVVGYNNAY